ncbi:MAG TPA: hypothetical protein VG106_02355, partial [Vicinamibacterales bacterium]|nr:hypothetical protein [Vicinamibacterales bacterium]
MATGKIKPGADPQTLPDVQTQIGNAIGRSIAPIIGNTVEATLKNASRQIETALSPIVETSIESHLGGDLRPDFKPPQIFLHPTIRKEQLVASRFFIDRISQPGTDLGGLLDNPPILSHNATELTDGRRVPVVLAIVRDSSGVTRGGIGLRLVKRTAIAIASIARTANVATVTTAAAHNVLVGESVTIEGTSDSSFHGTFVVLPTLPASSATTLTFASVGANVATTTTGGFAIRNELVDVTTTNPGGLALLRFPTITGETESSGRVELLGGSPSQDVLIPSGSRHIVIELVVPNIATLPVLPNIDNPLERLPADFSVELCEALTQLIGRLPDPILGKVAAPEDFRSGRSRLIRRMSVPRISVGADVASVSRADGIATIATRTAHGFAAGDRVTIIGTRNRSFSGTFTVSSIVSETSFTYTNAGPEV